MLVYRIQDDSGLGPYQNYNVVNFFYSCKGFEGDRVSPRRPSPFCDKDIGWEKFDNFKFSRHSGKEIIFGFNSIEQLKDWFNSKKCRKGLDKHGFSLVVFEIGEEHVLQGDKQVVFVKEHAAFVEKINLTDI